MSTIYKVEEGRILKIEESYVSMAEKASLIRDLLKKELKLSSRDVSVRKDGSAIHVDIKDINAIKYYFDIENIAKGQQNIDRDARTFEILAGGNTFVFVRVAGDLDKVNKIVSKEIEKIAPEGWLEDPNPSNENIILFGVGSIWVTKKKGVYTIKGHGSGSRDYKEIGSSWLHIYTRDSNINTKRQEEFKKTIARIFK